MKCVVGLGNPGPKYAYTRHNVGYMVISELARGVGLRFKEFGFSDVAEGSIQTMRPPLSILLVKPGTYMNSSGQAVEEILSEFPVTPGDLLVIHDDMDLPLGTVRLKRKGGSGGHKGVQSIISSLGTGDFNRLKVGVGRPGPDGQVIDYVLKPFESDQMLLLSQVVRLGARAALDVFEYGLEWAMGEYNGKSLSLEDGSL